MKMKSPVAVLDTLQQSGCDLHKPLEPEFLLGYHSQKMAYRKSAQSEQKEQDNATQSS